MWGSKHELIRAKQPTRAWVTAGNGREGVNIIAIAQGSSESNISFVIEEKAVKTALMTTHREFGLDAAPS